MLCCKRGNFRVWHETEMSAALRNLCSFGGKAGEHALLFTAEGFLMSFSLPNFFFHPTTAYDILRHKGALLRKT